MNLLEKLKSWARLLKQNIVMLWFATKHPQTPWLPKSVCIFIVAYALSPIDLIPDFIPILGYVDDLILLPVLIWIAIRLIPNQIIQESRVEADARLIKNQSKPRSYLGFLMVIVIWMLSLWLSYQLVQDLAS